MGTCPTEPTEATSISAAAQRSSSSLPSHLESPSNIPQSRRSLGVCFGVPAVVPVAIRFITCVTKTPATSLAAGDSAPSFSVQCFSQSSSMRDLCLYQRPASHLQLADPPRHLHQVLLVGRRTNTQLEVDILQILDSYAPNIILERSHILISFRRNCLTSRVDLRRDSQIPLHRIRAKLPAYPTLANS